MKFFTSKQNVAVTIINDEKAELTVHIKEPKCNFTLPISNATNEDRKNLKDFLKKVHSSEGYVTFNPETINWM